MDDFIKLLDKNLDYLEHEILEEEIVIYVASNRKEIECTYCGEKSSKTHSTYERCFQDLPILGKKTKIVITNRKLLCQNAECSHRTFAENFEFLGPRSRKTKRLLDKILDVSLSVSSVTASSILKDGIVDVGKSTICNLLKKRHTKT